MIEPQAVSKFGYMRGSMQILSGRGIVFYGKENSMIYFEIEIPSNTEAVFEHDGKEFVLTEGNNDIVF